MTRSLALLGTFSLLMMVSCATGEWAPLDASLMDGPTPDRAIQPPIPEASTPDSMLPPDCVENSDCDDGLVCNGAETCTEGACVAGTPVPCDDGVACTVDRCQEPDGSCVSEPDAGLCEPGEICHPMQGCRPATRCDVDADCDDGLACSGVERCAPMEAGADPVTGCVAGVPVDCGDGVACTVDSCEEPMGTCRHEGTDMDRDTYIAMGCLMGDDCDDSRSDVYPGAPELCDGVNNDCMGGADDGPGMECVMGSPATSCTTACGTPGMSACTTMCTRATCAAASETCNGCDDDADGMSDEGFACARGETRSCTTACGTPGMQTCDDRCGGFGACVGAEVCNDCDDDGDGVADDGFMCRRGTTRSCTTTCGSTGSQSCDATCTLGACAPPAETCNGLDDDCDGTPDNGFTCAAGAVESCTDGGCSGTRRCDATCGWGMCDVGGSPTGATCATASTISRSGSYSFSTCGASDDVSGTCGISGGRDVVYRLDVARESDFSAEITSGSFDTVLRLHQGDSCPGTEVACNDDGGTGTLSRIETRTLSAGTYWLVVDAFSSTSGAGAGVLDITLTERGPANDACGAAERVTLTDARTVITGTTSGASSDSTCASGDDVWYTFTLTRTEQVFIHTYGTGFDTKLALVSGGCGGRQIDCDDDSCSTVQSQIIETLPAGTYHLAVENFGSFTIGGDFTLTIERLPVGNDGVARALPAGRSTRTGTTSGSGVVSDCRTGTAPEHLYYWTQCPAASGGAFSGSTCSTETTYDTVVYLLSGATGASLGCNDDDFSCTASSLRSTVSATIPGGAGLFGFYVDGWSASSGTYSAPITRP